MIRRTFMFLCSGFALPLQCLRALSTSPGASTAPAPTLRNKAADHPPCPSSDPDWLLKWRETPKMEVFARDLHLIKDSRQRETALAILIHIRTGTPLTFIYHGGSDPGLTRNVLPTWLFFPDVSNHHESRDGITSDRPEPEDSPIYLLAWCLARNSARTFRLDRIQLSSPQPPLP